LFYFPKSYKRLEKIVRMYPANKFDTLNANTTFITMSEEDKGALRIIARSKFKPSAPCESGLIHLVSHGARYLAP
jgi:hypothetical protein